MVFVSENERVRVMPMPRINEYVYENTNKQRRVHGSGELNGFLFCECLPVPPQKNPYRAHYSRHEAATQRK